RASRSTAATATPRSDRLSATGATPASRRSSREHRRSSGARSPTASSDALTRDERAQRAHVGRATAREPDDDGEPARSDGWGRSPRKAMSWFEDFQPGDRMRHARGTTVGEVENQLLTKLVLNTAQAHFNEHVMAGSPMGDGRLVFGLVTGSIVIGLATQDTAEHAIAEVGLDNLKFTAPVHHG